MDKNISMVIVVVLFDGICVVYYILFLILEMMVEKDKVVGFVFYGE